MKKTFQVLSHTADFRIKIFGKNRKGLFENAFFALQHIMKPKKLLKEPVTEKIAVRSLEINTLLIDFLGEVLRKMQAKKALFNAIRFIKLGNDTIEAEISGNRIESFSRDVKAITYHEVEIKKSPEGGFETNIVFDI